MMMMMMMIIVSRLSVTNSILIIMFKALSY
jgi:hypothetical protein